MDDIRQRQAAFTAMVPDMVVSQTGKSSRYVGHPSGWRFVAVTGCFGLIVLAAAPKHQLSAAAYRVEGPVEAHVKALLNVV